MRFIKSELLEIVCPWFCT